MSANDVYIYQLYNHIQYRDMNNDNIPIIAMLYNFSCLTPSVLFDMHDTNLTMRVSIAKVDSEALTIAFCTVHARYIR